MSAISLFERQREAAINGIISIEGGYINDPNDKGGSTNYGINIFTLGRIRGLPVIHPILKNRTSDDYTLFEAQKVQRIKEIESRKVSGKKRAIIDEDIQMLTKDDARGIYRENYWVPCVMPDIASTIMMFDWGVNSGPKTAIERMQAILNVYRDGIIGPKTLKAAKDFGPTLLSFLVYDRSVFYRMIINKDPKQAKFMNGWMNRIGRILTIIKNVEAMT